MPDIKDLGINNELSVSAGGIEYSFVGLPQSIIQLVCNSIEKVRGGIGGRYAQKTVEMLDVIENAQQMFLSEEIKLQDKFWKEHCASSLRELTDGNFEANCSKILKGGAPRRADSQEAREISEIIQGYSSFLNSYCHFKGVLDDAKKLLEEPSLKDIDERVFDRICTDFVLNLYKYFTYKKK